MVFSLTFEKDYDLLKTIKFLRQEMIRVGLQEGLSSEKTLNISREMDILILKYQNIHNFKEPVLLDF
jgi:hypothetical protein